jgi:hypothetical protein
MVTGVFLEAGKDNDNDCHDFEVGAPSGLSDSSWPCCKRRGALTTGARRSKRILSAYPRSNSSYSARSSRTNNRAGWLRENAGNGPNSWWRAMPSRQSEWAPAALGSCVYGPARKS